MSLYLKLGDRTVFSLIRDHDLFNSMVGLGVIPNLMDLDARWVLFLESTLVAHLFHMSSELAESKSSTYAHTC